MGRLAYPVERDASESAGTLGKDWAANEPTIEAVLDLGTGHDVFVVATWEGAANLFVGLFTVDAGRLLRLPLGGQRELSLYGSLGVGSLDAKCTRHGVLTTYDDYPKAGRLTKTVTTYQLRGDRFRRVSTRTLSAKRFAAHDKGGQFAGCIVAGAVRP